MKQYSAYKKSKELQQKETDLANTLKTKPTWTGGNYQTKLADSLSNIENREKFSYDVNKDPLYQQYKDIYTSQGKLAMKDTMGQAAALTGGYGSSYASTAGNQAYQSYLTQLSSLIPELKNSARSEYDSETERLNNLYSLFSDAYNREYGEYGDKLSQWNTDRSYAYNDVNDTKNYDWSVYDSNRNDYNSVNQYNENMAYQKLRDAVADAQWQKEYDLSYYNAHKGSGSDSSSQSNNNVSLSKVKQVKSSIASEDDFNKNSTVVTRGNRGNTGNGGVKYNGTTYNSGERSNGTRKTAYEDYVEKQLDNMYQSGQIDVATYKYLLTDEYNLY